jgi:MFS family permease
VTATRQSPTARLRHHLHANPDHYKWVALSNTTLGILMATINSSIVIIALPAIFRGIHLNPLVSSNTSYLLWMLLGFLVVGAVLVVSLGRVGDMFGRVRMYNLGFAVFTVGCILLSVTWLQGSAGAMWMIVMRIVQGIGAAFLFANSSAILTDAFAANERGLALGINMVAAIAGSFIGLVLGGVLAPVAWRLVFLVSVPIGIFGTVWAYLMLEERGIKSPSKIDWWGNLTFAVGLIAVLVGITYGILPYGGHTMGWTNPKVIAELGGGLLILGLFVIIERRVAAPMFKLPLFRIRAFSMGVFATLLSALARGGLMFMLIIWLQGIWLPEHGYSYSTTPLWAGIYMLPLSIGFLLAGPFAGRLADHFGARPFTTGGMILAAGSFLLLISLPVTFAYWAFALVIFLNGFAMGLFAAPNQTGIMNSLPPDQRGAGAGMAATFMNSAMVLSIGIFFTLIIIGLASALPPRWPICRPSAASSRPSSATTRSARCCTPCSGTCRMPRRASSRAIASSPRWWRIRSPRGSTRLSTSPPAAASWPPSPLGSAARSTCTCRSRSRPSRSRPPPPPVPPPPSRRARPSLDRGHGRFVMLWS